MIAKLAVAVMVVLVPALGLGVATSSVFPDGNQIDPGVTLRVQAAGISNRGAPWQMGETAVARVRTFALRNEPLVSGSRIGDYPADYRGLIGYAWQLPQTTELFDPDEWSDALRRSYAVEIPHRQLQAGDVLANDRSSNFGHALLFVQWSNPGQWSTVPGEYDGTAVRAQFAQGVPFIAYELDRFNFPARVTQRQYTLKSVDGAMTIIELERGLHGPYDALRSNQIDGFAELVSPVQIKFSNSADTVTAQFTMLNRGGAPVALQNVGVIAYGPDALHRGIAGAQSQFPQIKQLILLPGQTYEYRQTLTLGSPGTYIAFPHFQANDIVQMPAQPAYFQIVVRQ